MALFNNHSKRVILLVAFLLIGCLFISLLLNTHAEASGTTSTLTQQTIIVHGGQSLWSIAQKIAKPNEDVRDVVYQLCQVNHLDSSTITPGMTLVIPNR